MSHPVGEHAVELVDSNRSNIVVPDMWWPSTIVL